MIVESVGTKGICQPKYMERSKFSLEEKQSLCSITCILIVLYAKCPHPLEGLHFKNLNI
jgi:hypothetical protein